MIVIYRLNEPRVGKDGFGWLGQDPPGSYPKSHRAYNECTKCCDTTPMVGKQCCINVCIPGPTLRHRCFSACTLPTLDSGGWLPTRHPPEATRSYPQLTPRSMHDDHGMIFEPYNTQ